MRALRSILTAGLATAGVLAMLPGSASASPANTPRSDEGPLVRGADLPRGLGSGTASAARRGHAQASLASARGFGGQTSDLETLALNATRRRVTLLLLDWSAHCDDGDTFGATTRMPRMPLRRGSFSKRRTSREAVSDGSLTYVNSVRGSVTNRRARGVFRTTVIGRDVFGDEVWRCVTGAVRFSLPRAYAGETAFGTPIVLGVSPDRRRVESLLGWWGAACSDPRNVFYFGDLPALTGGDVNDQGGFAATFTGRFPQPPWVNDVEAGVTGTLTPSRAAGVRTGHATIKRADTDELVETCDGRTTFEAVR